MKERYCFMIIINIFLCVFVIFFGIENKRLRNKYSYLENMNEKELPKVFDNLVNSVINNEYDKLSLISFLYNRQLFRFSNNIESLDNIAEIVAIDRYQKSKSNETLKGIYNTFPYLKPNQENISNE